MKKGLITLGLLGLIGCQQSTSETVEALDGTHIFRVYSQTNEFDIRRDIFKDPISDKRFDCAWMGHDESRLGEEKDVQYNTFASVSVDGKVSIDRENIGVCLDYKI